MRKNILILAVISFVLLQGMAFSEDLFRWSQLPDLQKGGRLSQWDPVDYGPQTARASDWICENGLPVTKISWWGSQLLNNNFDLQGFDIKIFDNVFSEGYNRPGTQLYDEFIPFNELTITFEGVNAVGSDTYKYQAVLMDPFEQIKDQTYWLSVIAITPDADSGLLREWRWQEAMENINNTTRVALLIDSGIPTMPDVAYCHWGRENERDLAFELEYEGIIPEPGAFFLMAGGFLALLYNIRSKNKQ